MSTKRTYPRRELLDPAKLDEAAEQVATLAHREGVLVALAGGLAMQYYGSDRLTGDVDFIAERLVQALPAGRSLSFGGEQTEAPNRVPVDMVVRSDDWEALYAEALREADTPADLPFRIVRPEYLVAMKMVAGRKRDEADLEFLLSSPAVDERAVRLVVRKHLGPYGLKDLNATIEAMRWIARKGGAP